MKRSTFLRLSLAASFAPAVSRAADSAIQSRKLVLIAGSPSHGPLLHEFRAGNILLAKRLKDVPGLRVELHDMDWVKDEATFDDADAVVIFSDGNARHPVLRAEGRLALMEKHVSRGMGFGCMHSGVEVPKEQAGDQFRRWMGGCYENNFSCNPIYQATFTEYPKHPITQGVQPYGILDEWYFNMRFAEGFDAEEIRDRGSEKTEIAREIAK